MGARANNRDDRLRPAATLPHAPFLSFREELVSWSGPDTRILQFPDPHRQVPPSPKRGRKITGAAKPPARPAPVTPYQTRTRRMRTPPAARSPVQRARSQPLTSELVAQRDTRTPAAAPQGCRRALLLAPRWSSRRLGGVRARRAPGARGPPRRPGHWEACSAACAYARAPGTHAAPASRGLQAARGYIIFSASPHPCVDSSASTHAPPRSHPRGCAPTLNTLSPNLPTVPLTDHPQAEHPLSTPRSSPSATSTLVVDSRFLSPWRHPLVCSPLRYHELLPCGLGAALADHPRRPPRGGGARAASAAAAHVAGRVTPLRRRL